MPGIDNLTQKFGVSVTPLDRLRYKLEKKYEELKIANAIKNKAISREQILKHNEEILESIKHKPIYSTFNNQVIYFKREMNDDFYFRKTKSTSINAAALEKCDIVVINIVHRDVKIMATKDEIKAYKDVKTFHGECKYYYPLEKWEIIQGDVNWIEKVYRDFQNNVNL